MQPVELKAIMDLPDGRELVQTGIYVFSTTTIAEIRDLMSNGCSTEFGRLPVKAVEFAMKNEEEEEK